MHIDNPAAATVGRVVRRKPTRSIVPQDEFATLRRFIARRTAPRRIEPVERTTPRPSECSECSGRSGRMASPSGGGSGGGGSGDSGGDSDKIAR
jgi:hypothetical protein